MLPRREMLIEPRELEVRRAVRDHYSREEVSEASYAALDDDDERDHQHIMRLWGLMTSFVVIGGEA